MEKRVLSNIALAILLLTLVLAHGSTSRVVDRSHKSSVPDSAVKNARLTRYIDGADLDADDGSDEEEIHAISEITASIFESFSDLSYAAGALSCAGADSSQAVADLYRKAKKTKARLLQFRAQILSMMSPEKRLGNH